MRRVAEHFNMSQITSLSSLNWLFQNAHTETSVHFAAWIRHLFQEVDSPFSQHVPPYPNRQLHPPLFGVPPFLQLPLLHACVSFKLYGHCPPHSSEEVFRRVRVCVPLVPQWWEQELQTLQLPTWQFTGLHGGGGGGGLLRRLRLRLQKKEEIGLIPMHKSRKQIVKMLIFISRFSQLFCLVISLINLNLIKSSSWFLYEFSVRS